MDHFSDLTLEEMAKIFCLDVNEFQYFLSKRKLNLQPEYVNGKLVFPIEQVQMHLQSQYFI